MSDRICAVNECENKAATRGWCYKHYARWRKYGDPETLLNRSPQPCSISGCRDQMMARGWCSKHYQRWKRYGDPTTQVEIQGDDWTRFWSKVSGADATGCWKWTDAVDKDGYGMFRLGRLSKRAHRVAWEFLRGEIPDHHATREPLVIDHLCRNPSCVNPWHLDPVTNAVNTRRGLSVREGTCGKGHPRTAESTGVNSVGARFCRICERAAARRRGRGQPPAVPATHCNRGHALLPGNLVASFLQRGWHRCLACTRAQSLLFHARKKGLPFDLDRAAHDAYDRILRGVDGRTARTGGLIDQSLPS